MKDTNRTKLFFISALALVAALALPSYVSASPQKAATKTFAQALVEQTMAKHPESDEIGISVRSARGCRTIASTDKSDLGEACEKDDVAPMQTGKPYVEKERDGFDVSVPLRDAQGHLIGSLGVGFKQQAGQKQSSVVAQALEISKEMSAQISSKARLFQRAK